MRSAILARFRNDGIERGIEAEGFDAGFSLAGELGVDGGQHAKHPRPGDAQRVATRPFDDLVSDERATIGGNYPQNQQYNRYSNFSPFGFNGRFLYARVGFDF